MAEERVNPFAQNDEDGNKNELPELNNFKPKTAKPVAIDKDVIDQVAKDTGFNSRVVDPETNQITSSAEPEAQTSLQRSMGPRRRTNKTEPLSMKVSKSAMTKFYNLVDEMGETLGDTFEHAVDALIEKREKAKSKK